MKEGLEEFLKRIEAKPTNETLIDRFVTLVLEEDVLERILYLKKLVGLLLTPNPYAALKAAALELQEARKERLTKEYEIGALKDVESCFLKLEKAENAQLVREEINKLSSDMGRDSTMTRARSAPPTQLPQADPDASMDDAGQPPARQARVHFRLPSRTEAADDVDDERTAQHRPGDFDPAPPVTPPKPNQRASTPLMTEVSPVTPPKIDENFGGDAFGYSPQRKASDNQSSTFARQKEFYDKHLEDVDDDGQPAEPTRRSSLSKASGIRVGPNLLESPEEREPPRPRNVQSIFDSTDVFGQKSERQQPPAEEKKSRSGGKPPKEATSKGKPRMAFEPADYGQDSNSMFQESQHVHFPETTSNRSMARQEVRGLSNHDYQGTSAVAASPLENTEILPEGRLMSAALPFDNEPTRQLDPEELLRSSMPPPEPAFPPREFDVPPYELANQKPEPRPAPKNKSRDPFAAVREAAPAPSGRETFGMDDGFSAMRSSSPAAAREAAAPVSSPAKQVDPFASLKEAAAPAGKDPFASPREFPAENNDPFGGLREASPLKDPIPFPKEMAAPKPSPAPPVKSGAQPPATEPRWSLLRDRLRLLTGIQISRSHASDFVLRLLGENSSREEQHEVLSILMRVLEGQRQAAAEQRFLAFLFEELHPKALHQLLGALKIGDQTVAFFVDYLQSLLKDRQLRRVLNVIHAVIIPGLDLSWYQESYRFLFMIWPELGLKGWHWLEEEGPMVFCDRLAAREDLMPATLLA